MEPDWTLLESEELVSLYHVTHAAVLMSVHRSVED